MLSDGTCHIQYSKNVSGPYWYCALHIQTVVLQAWQVQVARHPVAGHPAVIARGTDQGHYDTDAGAVHSPDMAIANTVGVTVT